MRKMTIRQRYQEEAQKAQLYTYTHTNVKNLTKVEKTN